MANRKETPDVLGELLGGAAPVPQPATEPEPEPAPAVEAEQVPAVATEPKPEPAPTAEADLASTAEPEPAAETEVAPAVEPKPAPRREAPSRRASRQRRATPAQWEHVEIVFCDHGGFRPRYISGKQVRNWKKAPLIHDYLNHLGEQGWELAGVGGRHKNQMPAYLKRLKA